MNNGWLRIKYELAELEGGKTEFTRTLTFDVTGLHRLLLPALKRNMAATSKIALQNLVNKLTPS